MTQTTISFFRQSNMHYCSIFIRTIKKSHANRGDNAYTDRP